MYPTQVMLGGERIRMRSVLITALGLTAGGGAGYLVHRWMSCAGEGG